jgi:hypothetical protein
MGIKWRSQFKCLRGPREIVQTEEIPILTALLCHGKLVARNVERSTVPAVGCFDFDQTVTPVMSEAGDVIACSIAILARNSGDTTRQIVPAVVTQSLALMMKDTLFSSATQGAIALVPRGNVEAAGNCLHLVEFGWRQIAKSRGSPNEEGRGFSHGAGLGPIQRRFPLRVSGQPA